ncbi:DNA polymerase/3'-5' exonuclease PolX [Patescibacteria group bacterium]|nr:MAG: DNA polymerase/3'-5' exonuclease PolX [Patescibacteria group bacterium]
MARIPSNQEIAEIFYTIADFLEMDEIPFKPRAYQRVAATIESLGQSLADIYNEGGIKALNSVPGVGVSIAEKIEELLKTGKLAYYEKLKKKMPVDVEALTAVEGVGPKTIKLLWKKLKVRTVADLEQAARAGKIRTLPRHGARAEQKILRSIEFQKRSRGRFMLGAVDPVARRLTDAIRKVPGVEEVVIAGSYRRRQETVGDIDILAIAKNSGRTLDVFCKHPDVLEVTGRGPTKANVRLSAGIEADLRVLPPASFGAALQYFTGDKTHNIEIRKIAIKKGWKLSEYGLFKGEKHIAGKTEQEIYQKLGLDWIPPELRSAAGEIEAAAKHALPQLIPYGSLKGDLQVQTNWTDGAASIAAMAEAAAKNGLSYIAITDHTRQLAMTGGLTEKDLEKQGKEIEALNSKYKILHRKFRILKSAEVNILKDGMLDIADAALKKLDLVCVAVHSHFNLSESEMTNRIIRALKHPLVNVLFHPTGRLIGRREPYPVDILKILRAAKEYGVAVEINGSMERLDLRDSHIREAVKLGVKLVVDSDAHAPHHYSWLELGVAQARRGWATEKDILNTLPCEAFLKALKR